MRVLRPIALLSLSIIAAVPLGAQSVGNAAPDSAQAAPDSVQRTPSPQAAAPVAAGPSLTGLRSGVAYRETARAAQPTIAPARRGGLGQPRAMMVVGVAAMITGAIIGGDPGTIIMVGGAVVGLIGLYDYLQ